MDKDTGRKIRRKRKLDIAPLEEALEPSEGMDNNLSRDLDKNKAILKQLFKDCSDVVFRDLKADRNTYGLLVYIDGMVKSEELHNNFLFPLLPQLLNGEKPTVKTDLLDESNFSLSQLSRVKLYSDVVDNILGASSIVLVDGYDEAVVINVIGGNRRGVEEPTTESVIRGPREGFTEGIRTNTGLLRFRIKSPRLKIEAFKLGEHTRTNVALAYIKDIADPKVVEQARNRLTSIHTDSILESGYIEELIEDEPYSPFPQLQYTERPDTVAASLLEGKFAIFVDGTPFVLLAPITFWEMMQASEDYYERYVIVNFIRWLRYGLLIMALFLPAIYIAVLTFHPDMLPTTLLQSIAAARESIPFPALVEALVMEIAFEALREAAVRLPKTVGQAVSILGALVIGQSAVQAGIVSAPMVIVVALTGIASFAIPKFNVAISIRLLRFPLMVLGSTFGLFGIVIGGLLISAHLCHLRSFGIPYLSGIAPYKKHELKDIFIRVPWWKMILRPTSYSPLNRKRMKKGMKPSPPQSGE